MRNAARELPAVPSDGIVLEFKSVSRVFGGVIAVDRVDLQVRRGEFLTLLGASGCGKTTMLRLMAGFEQPDSGDVLINGISVKGIPPYRRGVGMVFQNYALFPHLNVANNVAFGLEMRRAAAGIIRKRVADALEMVGLRDFGSRAVHELSGGQCQRVALARAIVVEPSVLLLDEPLGALDLGMRRQMQSELKQIQRSIGTTFVFVTHDQEEALSMSDRIAVCSEGRIHQLASPTEIYLRPVSRLVASFVGEANVLDAVSDGSQVRIACLEVSLPAGMGVQGPVLVVVRPEHIAVGCTLTPDHVRSKACITDVSFAGASVQYGLRVNALALTAKVPFSQTSCLMKLGEVIEFGWLPSDARLVPNSDNL